MKDLILILIKAFIILFLTISVNSNSFAGVKIGKGEVIMSERSVEWFIKYIRAKKIINQWLLYFQVMVNGQPTGIVLMDLVVQQITCQQLESAKKKQV